MNGVLRYLRRHHVALLALFFALAGTSLAHGERRVFAGGGLSR